MTVADFPYMPIPDMWRAGVLTGDERMALEAVAALNTAGHPNGWIDEASRMARNALAEAGSPPELVFVVGQGAELVEGLGIEVRVDSLDRDGFQRQVDLWVREDLVLPLATVSGIESVPPALLSEAVMITPFPVLVLARITMVDDMKQSVTVEMFGRTRNTRADGNPASLYEVTVPQRIVIGAGVATSGSRRDRREALYRQLGAEFAGSEEKR